MFAPSSHLSRSFNAPGTARRARTNENAGVHLPAKTPVRAPLGGGPFKGPGTIGRPLGVKTVERNVLANKEHPVDDIGPKRLFKNAGPSKPSTSQAPQKPMKTPAPVRQTLRTPAPQRQMVEPSPLPLPSAQRTRRRSRSSLSSQNNGTPEQSFAQLGPAHRWEEEVSLDSILEADIQAPEPDYELEYAPPKPEPVPFVPEWAGDVPDPVQSMKKIGAMRPLLFREPLSPPRDLEAVEPPASVLCPADELEHPALRRPKAKPAPAPKTQSVAPRSAVTRPGVAPRSRATPLASSKPTPIPRRPASETASVTAARTKQPPPRLNTRPATSTGSVRPGSMAPRSAASTSSRSPLTSRAPPASRPTTSRPPATTQARTSTRGASISRSGPVRAEPVRAPKQKSPEPDLAIDAAELEFGLTLDLELPPEPVKVCLEPVAEDKGVEEITVVPVPDEKTETAAVPEAVAAPAITVETNRESAPESAKDAASASSHLKVTLTAPDTSAEITQDLDASFVREAVELPEEPIPQEGHLAVPNECDTPALTAAPSAPASPVSMPVFDDSFDGEVFELVDLSPRSRQAEMPSSTVSTPNESSTAEGWIDEDMSFTDDVLAAAMSQCALGNDDGRAL